MSLGLHIHYEESKDINEFGVCTGLTHLRSFIKTSFEELFNQRGVFSCIKCYSDTKARYHRIIYGEGGTECMDLEMDLTPDDEILNISPDIIDNLRCNDVNFYFDKDKSNDNKLILRGDDYKIDVKYGIHIYMFNDLFNDTYLYETVITDIFDRFDLVLHPAYRQREVELTTWLVDFLREKYGSVWTVEDFAKYKAVAIFYK